jgi:hypothetical protein
MSSATCLDNGGPARVRVTRPSGALPVHLRVAAGVVPVMKS